MTKIVDQFGRPETIDPRAVRRAQMPGGALALGATTGAYNAASLTSQESANWAAMLNAPDVEINPVRNTIVARIRDLVRNDGWASGSITRMLDATIGGDFRLMAKPDWKYLSTLGAGFDFAWAKEYAAFIEARWRSYAYPVGAWSDLRRQLSVPMLYRQAFRHYLIDGEALGRNHWRPDRVGVGRGTHATVLECVDPDRLSNPSMTPDLRYMRGGIEIDGDGVPNFYNIREAHPGDWYDAARALRWERVPRELDFGRQVIIHFFDVHRSGQHRAAGGVLTPVVERLKMLAQYDSVELQAAVVNAIFAAFIESPNDPDIVSDSFGPNQTTAYQTERGKFHEQRQISLQGVRVPTLFPGEKINTVAAARPAGNFAQFEGAVLRNVAAVTGQSYEQLSQDWSQSNYSSARGALQEAWKTTLFRRTAFARGFATPHFAAWLEEEFDRGEVPLPNGAPDFIEAREAYAGCMWAGPPKGWIDPVKEPAGAILEMEAGLTTLEDACFEQGDDWQDKVEQRKFELDTFKRLGLPPMKWTGAGIEVGGGENDARPGDKQ